ncbi:MAG TPA: hypothetical protein VGY57_15175 [Vicinamibacterales bacterium]|nr:hypothetical protein [Vicinamibacterales bacterium]
MTADVTPAVESVTLFPQTFDWLTESSTGSINAQIPHPLFYNKPRSVSGQSTGLAHDETGVHLQAIWVVPATPRWSIAIAGGPSWMIVDQSVVTDLTVTSTYPFDTATYGSAVSSHASTGRLGYNVGADVTYRQRPHAGLGVTYSQASVPMTTSTGDTVTVDAGGVRVGEGLRVRF